MAGFEAGFAGYVGCYELVNVLSWLIYWSGDLRNNK